MSRLVTLRIGLALLFVGFFAPPALAQLPQARLQAIYPNACVAGESIEVVVAGSDLDEARSLLFSHPGFTAEPKTVDGETTPGTFIVAVEPDVPTGYYECRVVGRFGVSNVRRFHVAEADPVLEAEPNNEQAAATLGRLDAPLVGRMNQATDLDHFRFTLDAGRRVVFQVAAEQVDSKMHPAAVLYGPDGAEVASSKRYFGRDAILDYTPETSGDYTLRVYDFLYRGGANEYFYIVSASTKPVIDFVAPPVVQRGVATQLAIYGRNLPGGVDASVTAADGAPLQKLTRSLLAPATGDLDIQGLLLPPPAVNVDAFAYRLSSEWGESNPTPLTATYLPVVIEDADAESQTVDPPCDVAGSLYPKHDVDRYTFAADQGDVFRLEVVAQRLGLPVDPYLVVSQITRGDDGIKRKFLSEADDDESRLFGNEFNTASRDPLTQFTAPEDGEYEIAVRDRGSLTDPRLTYRLSVRRQGPDFRLLAYDRTFTTNPGDGGYQAQPSPPVLRLGGTAAVEVAVQRLGGFNGPVTLNVAGAPPSVSVHGCTIPAGRDRTTLVFAAASDAAPWAGEVQIRGSAEIAGATLQREANIGSLLWPARPNDGNAAAPLARVGETLAMSIVAEEQAPYRIEAEESSVLAAPGASIKAPVRVQRFDDFGGKVTLTALNLPGQVEAPAVEVAEDAAEATLELKPNKDAPIGSWNMVVAAAGQTKYRRNPEAVTAAAARLERIAAAQSEAETQLTAAEQSVAESRTVIDETSSGLPELETALAAATEQTSASEAAVKALRAALAAAETKLVADAEAIKSAAEKLQAARKKVLERQEQLNSAESLVVAKKQELETLAQRKQQAEEARKAAEEAAQPKDLNVLAPAAVVRVDIQPAPFVIKPRSRTPRAVAGQEFALELAVQRLPPFDGEISLTISGAGVLTEAVEAKIAGDADQARIALPIAGDASGRGMLEIVGVCSFAEEERNQTWRVPLEVAPAR